VGSEVQRRLLGLVAISGETGEQVNEEIAGAAVAGVLDLRDVLELVNDRLEGRPLAQQEPIGELEELLAHVLAQFRDEPQPLGEQEAFGKRSPDIALVAKAFAEETPRQAGQRPSVVGIAGSEAQREQFATVVDDQMRVAAVHPPHRRLAAPGVEGKDAMLLDARGMAHAERGGVDTADPRTLPQLRVPVNGQRHEGARQQGDETRIAQQPRKLLAQVDLDVVSREPFDRPLPRLLEEHEDGEDLRWVQPGCAAALACAAARHLTLPLRLEALPQGGDGANEVEYPHTDTSTRADGL